MTLCHRAPFLRIMTLLFLEIVLAMLSNACQIFHVLFVYLLSINIEILKTCNENTTNTTKLRHHHYTENVLHYGFGNITFLLGLCIFQDCVQNTLHFDGSIRCKVSQTGFIYFNF